jgi:1-acyl-sn-glycerol-3-phosphate acyltransferase
MRNWPYDLLKRLILAGFFCYFREIRMEGIDRVPASKPVMLLLNHQNALLDPLLYAAFARARRPYFLTRSDVFKNPLLRGFFKALRMLPIYRLRDGRETLQRNQEVFALCAGLFSKGEHVLLFPEANHNLRRQVRPLSKGFTRILDHALDRDPGLDLYLVPTGLNYEQADRFPDRVAFYFGEPFALKEYVSEEGNTLHAKALKDRVFEELTRLTTHIPTGEDYSRRIGELEGRGVDFLNPSEVNGILQGALGPKLPRRTRHPFWGRAWDYAFRALNGPFWLPWALWIKPKVWEPEFMGTFRFLYALIAYPLWLLLLYAFLTALIGPLASCIVVTLLVLHNLAYVKWRG